MRGLPQPASRQDSPLVSMRGAVLALVAATLLCWPMLIVSAPLMFFDSVGYVNAGGKILNTLVALVSPGTPAEIGAGSAAGTAAGTLADAVSKVEMLRSVPYSIYAFLTSLSPVGLAGSVIVQTAAVLFMFGALIKREVDAPPTDIVLAALACGTLTSLPWFASFLMPDILAAAVVLFAAVSAGFRVGPRVIFWLPIVFATMHFAYGIGSLRGFIDFTVRRKKSRNVPLTR